MSLQIGDTTIPSITFTNNYAQLSNPSSGQFVGTWVISIDPTQAPAALTKNGLLNPDTFQNIECILFYTGDIIWD